MSEDRRRKKAVRVGATGLLLVFVVYPASIGPLIWLSEAGYLDGFPVAFQDVLAVFYLPLHFIAANLPVLDGMLQWYVDLWRI